MGKAQATQVTPPAIKRDATCITRTRETATGQALAHVERAKVSLKGVHADNLSTDGVFFNPPMTLTSLKIAREELNKAIAVMEQTKWTR